MKKLLVGFVALVSMSAMAQQGKGMVQLYGYESERSTDLNRSLDIYNNSGGTDSTTTSSYALNYAYAVTDALQLGVQYARVNNEGKGSIESEAQKYGIFGIWNFAHRLTDTTYAGLKLLKGDSMTKNAAGDKTDADSMVYAVQVGHRFTLGTLWGMSYNWSPNLELGASTIDPDKGSDVSETEVSLNLLKVDVIF